MVTEFPKEVFQGPTEEQLKTMKQSVDSRLGSVSYSGADIQAIVFLPISQEYVTQEIEDINEKLVELRDKEITLRNELNDLSNDLLQAQANYDDAVASGIPADIAATQVILWNARDAARKWRELYSTEVVNALRDEQENLIYRQERLKQAQQLNRISLPIGNLQTISYSSFREKFPVRTLGRVGPKSYTRGARTIAGSMIFTVLHETALKELINIGLNFYSTGVGVAGSDSAFPEFSTILVDQLPPLDITLFFSNEVGDMSYMVLYGVELVSEGQTMSIQDMLTENVMQYVARDMDPLQPIRENKQRNDIPYQAKTVNDLLSARRRNKRQNPFI